MKPALVFAHGWGFHAGIWSQIAAHFVDYDFTYWGPEYICGGPPLSGEIPENAIVVAYSFGVAQILAARPLRPSALVSICGFDSLPKRGREQAVHDLMTGVKRNPNAQMRAFWATCGINRFAESTALNTDELEQGLKDMLQLDAGESLAENFSDGVIAPVLWLTVAGLPGIAAYKAINTSDSMIGHLSDRHRAFGYATAKLDDLINLPGSRISAAFLVLAAALHKKASASHAIIALRRDARRHRSPNAGWPESAMAGALGLKLGGPRNYDGHSRNDAWMGNGRDTTTPNDIKSALALYRTACAIQAVILATLSAGFMYLA